MEKEKIKQLRFYKAKICLIILIKGKIGEGIWRNKKFLNKLNVNYRNELNDNWPNL